MRLTKIWVHVNRIYFCTSGNCRPQWPRGLRRRSSATRLLRLWVRIQPGTWMFVCCECCVLSGRGLCDGLITRPGESYRMWRVVVCDQGTSKTRRLKPATGLWKIQPQWVVTPRKQQTSGNYENVVHTFWDLCLLIHIKQTVEYYKLHRTELRIVEI
jgi:hypothetical protein